LGFGFDYPTSRALKRSIVGIQAGLILVSIGLAANVTAEPIQDPVAKLHELSRQAEQTSEAMHTAEYQLNEKLAAQQAADKKHAVDQDAAAAAKANLATYQTAVNKLAATTYMGGHVGGVDAMLTAGSPQGLIDKMAMQRQVATQMRTQMAGYQAAGERAAEAERASAKSAADARAAAEQAAAVRAGLQSKQSQLAIQIAVVRSRYMILTAPQRTALVGPGPGAPVPGAVPGPWPGVPAPGALPGPWPGAPGAVPVPWRPGPFAPFGPGGNRAAVVQAAMTQIGNPYVWGGAAPGGFDCSGLVQWAYRQATGIQLPHSSEMLAQGGQPVALSDLQPGDVLTFYADASHTGIYVGNGMIIHASTFGVPVGVAPLSAGGPIFDARRY